jgi:hypothetical protein
VVVEGEVKRKAEREKRTKRIPQMSEEKGGKGQNGRG